jgi:RND family efflux transporter MFP subunit
VTATSQPSHRAHDVRRHAWSVTLLVFTLGFAACNREVSDSSPEAAAPVPVKVAAVERVSTTPMLPVAGTVRPFDRAVIAARVMGSVVGADFAIGQKVSAGDVLLTIQAQELAARLAQAQAALDLAARDAKREAQLSEQGASTAETARAAEDRLRVATAAFEEAKTLHAYTRVTAPFSGDITRKLIYTGDFVSEGTPLLEIEARTRMRAELDVPDTLAPLPLGSEVRVTSRGVTLTGKISEAAAAVHPSTRTRRVIVELPDGAPAYSGEFVRALWPAAAGEQLTVPANAVQRFGQIERVFVVADGRAALRIVRTGTTGPDRTQILSGVDAGENVVLSPPATLRDGDSVRVQP